MPAYDGVHRTFKFSGVYKQIIIKSDFYQTAIILKFIKMKILYITYCLSSGGAERFLTDLLNQIVDNKDVEITLLLIKSESIEGNMFYAKELSPRVKVKSLGLHKIGISVFSKLNKAIREEQPDIVHVHLSPIILFCILPVLFYKKPVYMETLHNEVSRIDNGNKIKIYLKGLMYKTGLIKVCCISDKNAVEFKRVYGKDCEALIYNGRKTLVRSGDFEMVKNEIDGYKSSDKDIVITHIARCAGQKNQKLLVESFNEIYSKYKNAVLLIIGSNFDSEIGKSLQEIACDKIHFLGEKHNIQDYLYCSDAFCLSSIYEGMPITLIEALSCGCIPISTPVSGVVDIIKDEVNGYISEGFEKVQFVDTMDRFIKHRHNINREKLMELFNKKLSIESCANSYLDFYRKCLR